MPSQDQTIKYTCDKGGNIVSKEVYNYCEGEIAGSVRDYDSYYYEYSNAMWNDVLTGVNGNAVGSDSMGNITQYKNNVYEWTARRQLSKSTDINGESMLF